ncbi:MAG: transcriptional regulator [Planctomycetota bacterium]|nr:MAG: transcriptional regulator [Planctomycetota bacterium]
MKLILAVLPPERLAPVERALAEVEVFRLTVTDVQGLELDTDGSPRLEPRVRLEIAVNEAFVEPTIGAIVRGAAGSAGHVLVLPLLEVVRVRTGERGPEAI